MKPWKNSPRQLNGGIGGMIDGDEMSSYWRQRIDPPVDSDSRLFGDRHDPAF